MLVNLEKVFPEAAKVQNLKGLFIETKNITKQWIDSEKEQQEVHILTDKEHYIIPHLDSGQIDIINIRFNDVFREATLKERPNIEQKEFRRKMRNIRKIDEKFRLQFS